MSKLLSAVLILILFLSLTILPGLGCKKSEEKIKKEAITLNYWSMEEKGTAFKEMIASFEKENPNIKINYQEIPEKKFGEKFLEALAEEKGPDFFSIPVDLLGQYKKWISPMPEEVSIKKIVPSGRNKVKEEKKTISLYSQREFRETFFDLISDALIFENKIYGIVLSLDTLALFYNKNIFNSKGIISPPLTWKEFEETVLQITELDQEKNILLSGAGLGTSNNIPLFLDILSALMLQTGTEMVSQDKQEALFNEPIETNGRKYYSGRDALRFYTDFANSAKSVYSYNPNLPEDIELFSQEKLGMIFGYHSRLKEIREKAPKINLEISPLPQIEGTKQKVNFGTFFVELVSKKSKHQKEAWYFLKSLSEKKKLLEYLEKANKITPRKDLLKEQKKNLELEIFLDQLLTAKNWYKGDLNLTKKAFSNMIEAVVIEGISLEKAIEKGVRETNEALKIEK